MIEAVEIEKVIVKSTQENSDLPRRLLDLNNIATTELRLLSPLSAEVVEAGTDRKPALTAYADRLRSSYKENENGFRDGLRLLSETLESGQSINVSCSCRGGEICHADVVKMAIEKVSDHLKQQQRNALPRPIQTQSLESLPKNGDGNNKTKREQIINPRTMRAINEILAVSDTDRLSESITQTDGRNRSEHASYLGRSSQFLRDLYERGANVVDGKLIVPRENLEASTGLSIDTLEYAVKRVEKILNNDAKAKEVAPLLVEYGDKIAGSTADGETKIKVFSWMYEALEGKTEFLSSDLDRSPTENADERFGRNLEEIRGLADEMHQLEPVDKLDFQPLYDNEQFEKPDVYSNEGLAIEEIYEEAISVPADESFLYPEHRPVVTEGKVGGEGFDRFDLVSETVPQLPQEIGGFQLEKLFTKTLPEIDRQLESGVSVKEILKPYREIVYKSAKDDVLNKLEAIYRRERTSELQNQLVNPSLPTDGREKLQAEYTALQNAVLTPTQDVIRQTLLERDEIDHLEKSLQASAGNHYESEARLGELRDREAGRKANSTRTVSQLNSDARGLSPQVKDQLEAIDFKKPSVISLSTPAEFREVQEAAEGRFFQVKHREIRLMRAELAQFQGQDEGSSKTNKSALKKELNNLQELRFSVAYKLNNSSTTVTGQPSETALNELTFINSYLSHQLKQPESRLRHENERFRLYAVKLETAATRAEIIDAASQIRAENASLGLKWKELAVSEKQQQPRPLTAKEMQFLFTEASPAHYTPEMTVTRLGYAHAGASRRLMAKALIREEIRPSVEARRLVDSLESRLNRKELRDSISATKHFFESIKTPDENLKYKNRFDHREVYSKLPPPEKDFVYHRAVNQKENLEYRQIFQQRQNLRGDDLGRKGVAHSEISKAETSYQLLSQFNQAHVLAVRIGSPSMISPEITSSEFNTIAIVLKNNSAEKVERISHELSKSSSGDHQKAAEILTTFANAKIEQDERKTTIQITLPEDRLVGTDTYKELLEKLHPDDTREEDKYKFSNFRLETIEGARTRGQDKTIKTWLNDFENPSAVTDALTEAREERGELKQHLAVIANLQETGRAARSENEHILAKYISRATVKSQDQKRSVPPIEDGRGLTEAALGNTRNQSVVANKENRSFFRALQNEITITDFRRFSTNKDIIDQNTNEIRERFTEVSLSHEVWRETKPKSFETNRNDNLPELSQESTVSRTPLSLRIYEAEVSRAEKQLLSKGLTERLSNLKDSVSLTHHVDPKAIFSPDERGQILAGASEVAKERLEPKELDMNHRSIPPEAGKQAIVTFKQLEASHYLYQYSPDKAKIAESFARLDKEAATLHQIRAAYTKTEKVAFLRTGIKSDLVDLLRKQPALDASQLVEHTKQIFASNLTKTGSSISTKHEGLISVLSREIGEKIENRNAELNREDSRGKSDQTRPRGSINSDRLTERAVTIQTLNSDRSTDNNIHLR